MIASPLTPSQPAQSVQPVQTNQPARRSQSATGAEELDARKQADLNADNRVKEREAAEQQAHARTAQLQKPQENVKPSVNTNGQALGKLINTTA